MTTTHLYAPTLKIFYREEMCPPEVASFSKSPTKPRRFMEFLRRTPLWQHVGVEPVFPPVTPDELLLAHTETYVRQYMEGQNPLASSSQIQWSREQRDSVLYTNGSLLAAIRASIKNPHVVTMSPTSGFHHARTTQGEGFCTFAGQVIAAMDLYRRKGLRGAWIDLDHHYGNAIPDAAKHTGGDIFRAIPENLNIELRTGAEYLDMLRRKLERLGELVIKGDVDYLCVAHGADSHEWDDLGGSVSTDEWVAAGSMVYESIRHWSDTLGKPIPVTLALFGGYRDDDPESVLGLHAMDTARCLHWLGGVPELERWKSPVKPPQGARR